MSRGGRKLKNKRYFYSHHSFQAETNMDYSQKQTIKAVVGGANRSWVSQTWARVYSITY